MCLGHLKFENVKKIKLLKLNQIFNNGTMVRPKSLIMVQKFKNILFKILLSN